MKYKLNCQKCNQPMVAAEATKEKAYRYVGSGLGNVWLVGITVLTCPKCGERAPVIPRILDLHRAIAASLLQKRSALRGDEIRFIRKHAGFPAQDFAALLGVTPSHLSRIENGKTPKLGSPADRLARMVGKAHLSGSVEFETLKQLASERVSEAKEDKTAQLELFLRKNRWQVEKAAA